MSFFTADNVATVTGGRWITAPASDEPLRGVGIDTRNNLDGRVFVAIRGATHDGHDFVPAATAARVIVVDRETAATRSTAGVLLVTDTRVALGQLAAAWRQTLTQTVVIAVTGSCGKTTVKSLLDTVLSARLAGRAAPRSFNNDIGLPLAILAARPDDRYLVLEIGANNPGEIAQLARIARPDIGVITMIGRAHLQGFGSVENVAAEKAAMLKYLQGRQLAVVNADAPGLRRHLHHAGRVVLFGESTDADLRLTGWAARGNGGRFSVNDRTHFDLGLPGRHNAVNAVAVVAVARQMGLDDRDITEALAACSPVAMRLSRHVVGSVTFYNDAYNANPDSTAASLESFIHLAADAPRRVLVLGDMLELGPDAAEQHREVGRRIIELDRQMHIDQLVLVGKLSSHTAEPILDRWPRERLTMVDDLDRSTAAAVAAMLRPGDAVLLKGSRDIGLETVIDAVAERQNPEPSNAPGA
ncbi:MAG: UDP-N-acetylmuramoyl-tripeptide--D-alanyl-D-alanine ligase [Planctomycetota bacterium]|nr:MAG: UDP-N-acetylmuramoyl-tripeptide--D-alanyl-D-alanine ligase [Planctomycetota bacterium]